MPYTSMECGGQALYCNLCHNCYIRRDQSRKQSYTNVDPGVVLGWNQCMFSYPPQRQCHNIFLNKKNNRKFIAKHLYVVNIVYYISLYACTHVNVYRYKYINIFFLMYLHMYMYIYIYMYRSIIYYIYIYMYTYISFQKTKT